MKIGVLMMPCAVSIVPARAFDAMSVCSKQNFNHAKLYPDVLKCKQNDFSIDNLMSDMLRIYLTLTFRRVATGFRTIPRCFVLQCRAILQAEII